MKRTTPTLVGLGAILLATSGCVIAADPIPRLPGLYVSQAREPVITVWRDENRDGQILDDEIHVRYRWDAGTGAYRCDIAGGCRGFPRRLPPGDVGGPPRDSNFGAGDDDGGGGGGGGGHPD